MFIKLPCLSLTCLAIAGAAALNSAVKADEEISKHSSKTEKHRISWVSDPATSVTICWNQLQGKPGVVYFGEEDERRKTGRYPKNRKTDRVQKYDGMTNCFVRLSGLSPDTRYFFCIKDESGVSRRFQFHTAPDKPQPFTFIAGGDSRNFRDVRIAANKVCEKLCPLFVAFTGDMINKDVAEEWDEWLDDWEHLISEDGHIIPIVAHRGNHERRPETIHHLFDTPEDAYFSFSVGGNLFHYLALNSEIPAGGAQEKWMDEVLAKVSKTHTHLVAGYHKPMRPHVSAKSEGNNPMLWADNFYRFGLDLSLESDSHVMKRTFPLKPQKEGHEGFAKAINDPNATVYIGEGCWGAPLRKADDRKPWTLDTASFNGLDWIEVTPEKIRVKTVEVSKSSAAKAKRTLSNFKTPEGLSLWQAHGGEILEIPADL